MNFDFFPASSYHGPFIFLLRSHPTIGIKFIVRLLNYCATCYADQEINRDIIEHPFQVTFQLPNGTNAEQWCSDRLWSLYRGTSAGPYIIQNALMALERWLFELCPSNLPKVEQVLINLLKCSNNVAITAVVASVATAYPQLFGQAAISLLTCPLFFELDIGRVTRENDSFNNNFPDGRRIDIKNAHYYDEREKADGLQHRIMTLESLAINLQTGPYRDKVWQILDSYHKELPPIDQQTEEDRLWRLALHRMDLRRYEDPKTTTENGFILQPKPLEPDLQKFIAKDAPTLEAYYNRISLVVWSRSTFDRDENSKPDEWRQRLLQAQDIHLELETMSDSVERQTYVIGLPRTAAICIRDHWDELTHKERDWCVEVILQTMSKSNKNSSSTDGSSESAFILPALLCNNFSKYKVERLHEAVALSLTHASQGVVARAAEGVGMFLWEGDREMTLTCIAAIAYTAKLESEFDSREKAKPYSERLSRDEIASEVADKVCTFILRRESLNEQELFDLDLSEAWGRVALQRLIQVFGQRPQEDVARKFFRYVAEALVGWWNKYKDASFDKYKFRNYWGDSYVVRRLANFALALEESDAAYVCDPIINAVSIHPEGVSEFVKWLAIAEDSTGSGMVFWGLWEIAVDSMNRAPWIDDLDKRNSDRVALLDALFLGLSCDKGVRHWQRLEGNEWRLDRLFEKLHPSSVVLVAYCRFLYQIGDNSLPHAFEIVSKKVKQGDPEIMLSNNNSVSYLESILRRYIYGQPGSIKSKVAIRDSVLYLLDELVEKGSSAAYRMRDDFVTPQAP